MRPPGAPSPKPEWHPKIPEPTDAEDRSITRSPSFDLSLGLFVLQRAYSLPPFSRSWAARCALTSITASALDSISPVLSHTSSMARHAILRINPTSSGSLAYAP